MPDIFLSYCRDDLTTARRFAEAFEREGLSVWWDQTLNPGEAFDEVTEKALNEAKAVVVLWSKKSVASRWVRAEATQANDSKTLVPVMIEPCKRPIMFELTHTADLSQWTGDSAAAPWRAFIEGLRRTVGKAVSSSISSIPQAPAPARSNRYGLMIIVIVALIMIGPGLLRLALRQTAKPATEIASSAQDISVARTGTVTLAVLPFADMSPAKDQEYFSDGLTEEILNQLAQNNGLRVTGRTSSFSFKGRNEDLRTIAKQLGVANLLEGSIRKEGNDLRITAQLIDGRDGSHLWSRTYARQLKQIFAVQEEIAKDVAQALSVRLDVGEMSRARGGTTNVEAYDKYLRARTLFYQLGPKQLEQSAQLYREALGLDPDFARAWSGLCSVLTFALVWIPENSVAERKELAAASARVVALAPDAWWTQTMRAEQFALQRKWPEAEAAATSALSSAPASEIEAIRAYGIFLSDVGRSGEALEYYSRARQIDPLSLGVSGLLQLGLDSTGRREEAQTEYERSKGLAGDHAIWDWWALKRTWSRKGVTSAEVAAQYRVLLGHESLPMALNQKVADNLGNKEAVLKAIQQALADPANQDATRMSVVAEYANHFGDQDTEFAALRRSLVDLGFHNTSVLWSPMEGQPRSDPRFKQILRDMHLVEYFRASGNWGDLCKPVGKDDFECH